MTSDWDDIRYFLALALETSVRGAGQRLGVSHTTVVRRIEVLERKLDTRLFDRRGQGFILTEAGSVVLEHAKRIEEEAGALERLVLGQDQRLEGELRFTAPDALITHLLMPDLSSFMADYPAIDLEIIASDEIFDLSQRQADVAVRMLRLGVDPPDHLIGRKLCRSAASAFALPDYLEPRDLQVRPDEAAWIGWSESERHPPWVATSSYPDAPRRGRLNNILLQLSAARAGMGMTVLPCFVGDVDDRLARVPGTEPRENFDIWLLTHADLRETARFRTFRAFIAAAILREVDLLEGRRPRADG